MNIMKKSIVLFLALLTALLLFGGCSSNTEPTPTVAPTDTATIDPTISPVVTISPNVSDSPNEKGEDIITKGEEKVKEGVDKLESAVPKMAERDTTTENRKTAEKKH